MKIRTDLPILDNPPTIIKTIASFWDKISEGWRTIWGIHIHHGYYENEEPLTPLQAQEKLIEKLTEILQIENHAVILDAGCGMGGSSIYLAKKYQARITGITLSQKQAAIATQLAQAENLKEVSFKIENALSLTSVADNSFDIVWSLESCEQFYDKDLFIQQAHRVLKPGGKLMLVTWCSACDEYEGKIAKQYRDLCVAFSLPYMPTIEHYHSRLIAQGFKVHDVLDWTHYVAKSWDIGVSLVSAYRLVQLFKIGGLRGLRFIKEVKMMQRAFQQNMIRYGVLIASKA